MTWLKVDDHMVENGKISPLSDAGFRALIELWSYSSRNLTDGLVPTRDAKRLAGKSIRELVNAGLFDEVSGGIVANDWLEHNPPAQTIKDRRAAEAARQKALRDRNKA